MVVGEKYLVPSATQPRGEYVVDATEGSCTCPDWQECGGHGHAHRCKHVFAVLVIRREIALPDGEFLVTEEKVHLQYPRDFRATNRSQVDLYRMGPVLIADLVSGIPLSSTVGRGRGRPRAEVRDIVQGALLRTFEERTARETVEAMERSQKSGLWQGHALPHYNTLLRELANPALMPIFQSLINESAKPLVTIERNYAIDSTGFSTSVYESWFRRKHGPKNQPPPVVGKMGHMAHWVKAHACVGTATHVVTAIEVTENKGKGTGDTTWLPELVLRTVRNGFIANKISADGAYLSAKNIQAIQGVGANAFITFHSNTTGSSSPVIGDLFHQFITRREWYEAERHNRSNVETAFSMIKLRYGGYLRSRTPAAQYNELMAKAVVHNVACIIQAFHELQIDPKFWMPHAPPPDTNTAIKVIQ